jgi:hypothetical protein
MEAFDTTHDVIFISANSVNGEMIGPARGYISLTQINFVNKKICVNA